MALDTKYHSGTVALGWVPKIAGEDVEAFEKNVQQRDPSFHVYEITGHGVPMSVNTREARLSDKISDFPRK
ncbi:MAG: hypothetical protein ACI9FO_000159 [Methylophagaceae bacterium]